jgi:hypothetical protein
VVDFTKLPLVNGGEAGIQSRTTCDRAVRMMTIASVPFKVRTFDSTMEATALSILRVVVPASAVVRILKWKIAIGPFAIGFCPPERIQE